MEHIDCTPTRKYRCCNYCKYFHPDSYNSGYCKYDGKYKQDIMLNKYLNFYNWGCVIGYKHTIHNHYNLPYPQYANEYAYAVKVREQLEWDIYREKHRRGPVYMDLYPFGAKDNFFDDLKK